MSLENKYNEQFDVITNKLDELKDDLHITIALGKKEGYSALSTLAAIMEQIEVFEDEVKRGLNGKNNPELGKCEECDQIVDLQNHECNRGYKVYVPNAKDYHYELTDNPEEAAINTVEWYENYFGISKIANGGSVIITCINKGTEEQVQYKVTGRIMKNLVNEYETIYSAVKVEGTDTP